LVFSKDLISMSNTQEMSEEFDSSVAEGTDVNFKYKKFKLNFKLYQIYIYIGTCRHVSYVYG